MEENELIIFQNQKIRARWDRSEEKWYFSIIDVIAVLTDNDYQKARNYWKVLKSRLNEEGNQSVTNCNQLKLKSSDGKFYSTDVGDTVQIFRLIQSIPSKKAEPFKSWLAKVGKERIDETYDPEITINRALETYRKKGYSEEWINQRLRTIEARKEFTDELKNKGINSRKDFATLTNLLTETWSGFNVREYKDYKGLTKENLRDNMTNTELVLNMLAEVSSTEISKSKNKEGYTEAEDSVTKGGAVAKIAREELEKQINRSVISSKNAREIKQLNK